MPGLFAFQGDGLGTTVFASAAKQSSGATPAAVALPWVTSLRS
jgi:hypothetical protein